MMCAIAFAEGHEGDPGLAFTLLSFVVRQTLLNPQILPRFDEDDVILEIVFAQPTKLKELCFARTFWERLAFIKELLNHAVRRSRPIAKCDNRGTSLALQIYELLRETLRSLETLLPGDQFLPEERAEREKEVLHLAQVIDHLPKTEQDIVILKCTYECEKAEIADRLRQTEWLVSALYQRAVRRLGPLVKYLRR
jgi:RNA polymerase sigma factor (sigma-70 family)